MRVLFKYFQDALVNNGLAMLLSLVIPPLVIGGYLHFSHKLEVSELTRQCEVYRNAVQNKLDNLNRSNDEVSETIQTIDPDNLDDWVDRINGMQRDPE